MSERTRTLIHTDPDHVLMTIHTRDEDGFPVTRTESLREFDTALANRFEDGTAVLDAEVLESGALALWKVFVDADGRSLLAVFGPAAWTCVEQA